MRDLSIVKFAAGDETTLKFVERVRDYYFHYMSDTRAFYDNPISSVIIPDNVRTIENNAFNKLTKITVGSNLSDLKYGAINGNNAFRDAYTAENGGAGTYVWDGKSWIKS